MSEVYGFSLMVSSRVAKATVNSGATVSTTAAASWQGIYPTFDKDENAQSAKKYAFQSDGGNKLESETILLASVGDTWDVRFDWEGNWASETPFMVFRSGDNSDELTVELGGGAVQLKSDGFISDFDVGLAHGVADSVRKQARLLITWNPDWDLELFTRDATLPLDDDTGWTSVATDDSETNALSEAPATTQVSWGYDEPAGSNRQKLVGVFRELFFEAVTSGGGTVTSHWTVDGTSLTGADDESVTDEDSYTWTFRIEGTNTVLVRS